MRINMFLQISFEILSLPRRRSYLTASQIQSYTPTFRSKFENLLTTIESNTISMQENIQGNPNEIIHQSYEGTIRPESS